MRFTFRHYILASSLLIVATCYITGVWTVSLVSLALLLFMTTFALFLHFRPTFVSLSCASLSHFFLVGLLVSDNLSNPVGIVLATLYLSWFGQLPPLLLGAVFVLSEREESATHS